MAAEAAPQDQSNEPVKAPQSDKDYNWAQMRQQLDKERQEKAALQQELNKAQKIAQQKIQTPSDDEDDRYDEPYVDEKRLEKKLAKFGQRTQQETDERINSAVQRALSEERKQMWLKSNPDFYKVMEHAQAFADKDPELAETILEMPEGFERQKLVYRNIKAMGLHEPPKPKSDIQETIDKNRRSPYYQPNGVSSPGYGIVNGGKDYNAAEGKNAYSKMKELQKRIGPF